MPNPLRRQIRLGHPPGNAFGVGDIFLMTPLARQADVTWQMPVDSSCAADLSSILQSVARIEWVKNPINEDQSLAEYRAHYGGVPSRGQFVNASQRYLQRYGLDTSDCIPEGRPPAHEIEWAHRWLAHYRRPIVFSPVPGNFASDPTNPHRLSKWVPPEHWRLTLEKLSAHHDILYFNTKDNHVPFPSVHTLLGFSTAKIAAVQYLTKRHMGCENGLLHMGVAMGAECWVGIPTANLNVQALVPFLYEEQLWGGKPNRVSYIPITGPKQAVRNISFSS